MNGDGRQISPSPWAGFPDGFAPARATQSQGARLLISNSYAILMHRNPSLDVLLDLDGVIIGGLQGGRWVKFAARRVPATEARPHGIRYSLTLHDANGARLFGLDNAHPVASPRSGRMSRAAAFDHVHPAGGTPARAYTYRDAATLMRDFWAAVDHILEES